MDAHQSNAAHQMPIEEASFPELARASLGGDGKLPPGGLSVALARDFGSVETWRSQFIALAQESASGWAVLGIPAREQRLGNYKVGDDASLPAGVTPILAASAQDLKVSPALDTIQWGQASARYVAAVACSTGDLALSPQNFLSGPRPALIDVRRKGAYDAGPNVIEGAQWRDPERVDQWAAEFSGKEVVVYCVFGHEVGQSTAARLRNAGVKARFLEGGIDQWKAAGRPMQPK